MFEITSYEFLSSIRDKRPRVARRMQLFLSMAQSDDENKLLHAFQREEKSIDTRVSFIYFFDDEAKEMRENRNFRRKL